jgi:hypothetical protein
MNSGYSGVICGDRNRTLKFVATCRGQLNIASDLGTVCNVCHYRLHGGTWPYAQIHPLSCRNGLCSPQRYGAWRRAEDWRLCLVAKSLAGHTPGFRFHASGLVAPDPLGLPSNNG